MNNVRQIITDELLEAFVDGELDAATGARIEAALTRDARLAARVAHMHGLRTRLQARFSPVISEPVPARLQVAAAGRPDPGRMRAALRLWAFVIAALAAGTLLGMLFMARHLSP